MVNSPTTRPSRFLRQWLSLAVAGAFLLSAPLGLSVAAAGRGSSASQHGVVASELMSQTGTVALELTPTGVVHTDANGDSAQRSSVAAATAQVCPQGTAPHLQIAVFSAWSAHGAMTPELAVRTSGAVGPLELVPMGKANSAPVWIVAGQQTFVATILSDGTWFASPARLLECKVPSRPEGAPPDAPGPRG